MRSLTLLVAGIIGATVMSTTAVDAAAETTTAATPSAETYQESGIEGSVRAAEQPQRLAGVTVIMEGGGTRRDLQRRRAGRSVRGLLRSGCFRTGRGGDPQDLR